MPRRLLGLLVVVTLAFPASAASPAASTPAVPTSGNDIFAFVGSGWGHGIGMSQHGARTLAADGRSASQILSHYYTGTSINTSYPTPGGIRVLLADRSGAVTLSSAGSITIQHAGRQVFSIPSGSVKVDAVGTSLVVNGTPYPGGSGQTLVVSFPKPMKVSATGFEYLWGRIELSIKSSGVLRVVESNLAMERYVYGIAEMPASWPRAALRAQATAARSYATEAIERRRASSSWTANFDLYASVQDQAYIGWSGQNSSAKAPWVAAVDATASDVITHGGSPIAAYYSASSGGHTENSEYVWANPLPYARGVPDPRDLVGNPWSSWTREYTRDEVSRWMSGRSDTHVGTVQSISVTGTRGVSGRVDKATVVVVGSERTITITGGRLFSRFNAAIIGEGGGISRQLPSTLFSIRGGGGGTGSDPSAPTGSLDRAVDNGGAISIAGWAVDPDTPTTSLTVDVVIDGRVAKQLKANQTRSDIPRAFPGYGSNLGFSAVVAVAPGRHEICVQAKSTSDSGSVGTIGCSDINVVNGAPFGVIDRVSSNPGAIKVSGWAFDRNGDRSLALHIYVDGAFAGQGRTGGSRSDVAAAFGQGARSGFTATVPAGNGARTVCVYAIDQPGGGVNSLLGCRRIEVRNKLPIGVIDRVQPSLDGISVAGWAFDPDSSGPTSVHVYIDGGFAGAARASVPRPDVGAAFGRSPAAGFGLKLPASSGSHTVCVYAINQPTGANPLLGCSRVSVTNARPIGVVDGVRTTSAGVAVFGWTFDQDSSESLAVHVYVDGTFAGAATANAVRPDVGAAFGVGDRHGFRVEVPASPGSHNVCVYAINRPVGGANPLLGCARTS